MPNGVRVMLIAFHKPWGVLSQFNANPDQPDQRTLSEFGLPKGMQPLGRLDMDSEGLLLLTDEKALERRYLSRDSAHTRTYYIQIEGSPLEEALGRARSGIMQMQGQFVLPCLVDVLDSAPDFPPRDPPVRDDVPTTWLRFILREGKNRQVRRMTAMMGCPTLRLVRVAIGGLTMPMEAGTWMAIPPEHYRKIDGICG